MVRQCNCNNKDYRRCWICWAIFFGRNGLRFSFLIASLSSMRQTFAIIQSLIIVIMGNVILNSVFHLAAHERCLLSFIYGCDASCRCKVNEAKAGNTEMRKVCSARHPKFKINFRKENRIGLAWMVAVLLLPVLLRCVVCTNAELPNIKHTPSTFDSCSIRKNDWNERNMTRYLRMVPVDYAY